MIRSPRLVGLLLLVLGLMGGSAALAAVSIDAQVGISSSYDYPLLPWDENAVDSGKGNLAASLQINSPLRGRWSWLAGGAYWADKGDVILGKHPEEPDREVASRVTPIYAGIRYRVGPLEQRTTLHFELAGGLVFLRSRLRDIPSEFASPLLPPRSSVESAPVGRAAAVLSMPFSPALALALSGAYLYSGDFSNDESLLTSQRWQGLRQFLVSAGIEVRE